MKAVVAESVSNRRFTMALVATFAILAFALVARRSVCGRLAFGRRADT